MPPILTGLPVPLVEGVIRLLGRLMKGIVKEVPELAAVFALAGAMVEHYVCAHPILFACITLAITTYGFVRYARSHLARLASDSQASPASPASGPSNSSEAPVARAHDERQGQAREGNKTCTGPSEIAL